MLLSVIIVNYNVRYFLEQCLHSVLVATAGMDAEIIVVDNHSSDNSIGYLQPLFPTVHFIANAENRGFARANNQGLDLAKGEYLLFLNPDTLVPEDCLQKCISFLQLHPQTGALGVQMLDGSGAFLPESKRAFPSPMASLFKLTGLAGLFPGSSLFNKYALGGLDKEKDQEVPVLAGAFLMGRTTMLKELGGFDEDFFLYGEDIDLSYRINKAGWKTHYLASAPIIHFKGESSGRAPLDSMTHFYRAMRIFVKKHYSGSRAGLFLFFINIAIRCREVFAFIGRLIKPVLLPLIDGFLVWLSLQIVRISWIGLFREGLDFQVPFIAYALPLFAGFFVLCAAMAGLYDKVYRSSRSLVALCFAVVSVLAAYSLLPESLRFSRGVMITGSVMGALLVRWLRFSLFRSWYGWMGYTWETGGQTLIAGDESEYAETKRILEDRLQDHNLLGRVAVNEEKADTVADLKNLPGLLHNNAVKDLVFCVGSLRLSAIIAQLKTWKQRPSLLFHMRGSHSLVGSDLRSTTGRTLGWSTSYRIAEPYQRRMKRMVDILIALIYLLTAPLHLLFHKRPLLLLRNAWLVLSGSSTWVGYLLEQEELPPLKRSVIPQSAQLAAASDAIKHRSDRIYALNYDWLPEMGYIFSRYRSLGEPGWGY
jgi:GT2 family glycosyltransferase